MILTNKQALLLFLEFKENLNISYCNCQKFPIQKRIDFYLTILEQQGNQLIDLDKSYDDNFDPEERELEFQTRKNDV